MKGLSFSVTLRHPAVHGVRAVPRYRGGNNIVRREVAAPAVPSFVAVAFCLFRSRVGCLLGTHWVLYVMPLIFIGYKLGVIANLGRIEQSGGRPSLMQFIKKERGYRVSQASAELRSSSKVIADGSSQRLWRMLYSLVISSFFVCADVQSAKDSCAPSFSASL